MWLVLDLPVSDPVVQKALDEHDETMRYFGIDGEEPGDMPAWWGDTPNDSEPSDARSNISIYRSNGSFICLTRENADEVLKNLFKH